jgi:hypothetical protein
MEAKDFALRARTGHPRVQSRVTRTGIIGPRRVLLKHRRQWDRTKCICVTIGDLCELFRGRYVS